MQGNGLSFLRYGGLGVPPTFAPEEEAHKQLVHLLQLVEQRQQQQQQVQGEGGGGGCSPM
jgi:hypothetical protein